MAGQALAALPEENITEQLSSALQRLKQTTTNVEGLGDYTDQRYPVPGESNSVAWAQAPTDISVAFGPDGYREYQGDFTVGNAAELKKIEDAGITDVLEIAWHSPELEDRPDIPAAPTRISLTDTENTPKRVAERRALQDKRTALRARSAWSDYLATLPDNVMLHNRPVGGLSGDYARADLYMREGFGPVGENGAQYAIKRNGQLEPVAPMGTHQAYAEHLTQRLGNTGESELSANITNELQRRKQNRESLIPPAELERERQEREWEMNRGDADDFDDYDDGSYDDYDPNDTSGYEPEFRRFNAERDYERIDRVNTQDRLRDTWSELEDSHTMNTIYAQGIRNRQVELARELSAAQDNLNFVNQRFPRPVPMPITSSPYDPDAGYRSPNRDDREQQFYASPQELADTVRHGAAYHMAENSPENLRGYVKQRFARPRMREDGVLEMRENYGPEDVQMLRDLQVQQALNPKIEGSGPNAYGISTPLDMVSSDVPVQWIAQDGTPRGPAAPITGTAGTERGMAMRRNNWEDDKGFHQGNAIWGYNLDNRLQTFIDESGASPQILFPGQERIAQPWDWNDAIPF